MFARYTGLAGKYLTPEERKRKRQMAKHKQTCAKNRKKRKLKKKNK